LKMRFLRRYRGHSVSDPGNAYRTKDDVTAIKLARDPIDKVLKLLIEHNFASEGDIKAIQKKVNAEIDAVIQECMQAPLPEMSMLQSNLYMQPNGVKMRSTRSEHWLEATVKPYVKPT
jgi:pyruvate dehydrogenase E1 component alpha subunit